MGRSPVVLCSVPLQRRGWRALAAPAVALAVLSGLVVPAAAAAQARTRVTSSTTALGAELSNATVQASWSSRSPNRAALAAAGANHPGTTTSVRATAVLHADPTRNRFCIRRAYTYAPANPAAAGTIHYALTVHRRNGTRTSLGSASMHYFSAPPGTQVTGKEEHAFLRLPRFNSRDRLVLQVRIELDQPVDQYREVLGAHPGRCPS